MSAAKILWLSPYSLHDMSSTAAVHCRSMLEKLSLRRFRVIALSSFITDGSKKDRLFSGLREHITGEKKIFEFSERSIDYIYTSSDCRGEDMFTMRDASFYYETCLRLLDEYKPDFVFGFGTSPVSVMCRAAARRRGAYSIYVLLNDVHDHYAFPECDLLITDSAVTAKLYETRDHIRVLPLGSFTDSDRIMAKERIPKYVTFADPSPNNGFAVFAALSAYCRSAMPEVKFLLTGGSRNFAVYLNFLRKKNSPDTVPFQLSDFDNVIIVPEDTDIRSVYAETKILLDPKIKAASYAHRAAQALLNGIPVLASDLPVLREVVGRAGSFVRVPADTKQNPLSCPSESETAIWAEELRQMLSAEESFADAVKRAQDRLDIDQAADRVASLLRAYYAHGRRFNIYFGHDGFAYRRKTNAHNAVNGRL